MPQAHTQMSQAHTQTPQGTHLISADVLRLDVERFVISSHVELSDWETDLKRETMQESKSKGREKESKEEQRRERENWNERPKMEHWTK